MIDWENKIFNYIATKLRKKFAGIYVVGENSMVTADNSSFPAVSIVQRTNAVKSETADSGSLENHADVMFEVDAYSNLSKGKKQQAKEITAVVSDLFMEIGFARTFCQPLDNLAEVSIFRMKSRYKAVIGKDGLVYTK